MLVENHIAACRDRRRVELRPEQRKGWCTHRILLPGCPDAPSIAAAFRDRRKFEAGSYTGGEMPYSIIVTEDGRVQQALELCEFGPHALTRWSTDLIGVAAVGDFRTHGPSSVQLDGLADICSILALWTGDAEGIGHTSLPYDWDGKECPGRFLSMTTLRSMVADRMPDGWRSMAALGREQRLLGAGLVI